MNPKTIPIVVFFGLLTLISLHLVHIFDLVLIPMLWAVILAIVVYPLYRLFLKLFRGRRNWASLIMTLLVVGITTGPMILFSGTLAGEALDFYGRIASSVRDLRYEEQIQQLLESPVGGFFLQIKEKLSALNVEIVPLVVRFFENLTNIIVRQMQEGAKNFLVFLFDYLVTVFVLFFFLRDGEAMLNVFKDLIPMSSEHKETVLGRIEETLSAVVRGVGLTGITQGILSGLAFWILGVPYPLFLGLLIAFLAFVPLGGAAMIWIPSSLYLYMEGSWGKALILFLWGTLVISMVDNFLKPYFIGERTKLPTVFLFFSILGGLSYYGFIGVFLGPLVLALFLSLIQIYRQEYAGRS
ncbi:MAG: AI-2E family transporter [Deltaproteobacteria bacterium]|nr:AI-2E family transporter [Deltaproteobacteria bacterium]